MDTLQVVEQLYTNKKSKWILELQDDDIQPLLIQKWLLMNEGLRIQTRWLDKYTFSLPPKMYLSLAWSIIPKVEKMPFTKYIKKEEKQEEELEFILMLVRRQYKLSDNDYNSVKERLKKEIKKDMVNWFKYYGIKKAYWKQFYLNFNFIKENNDIPVTNSLEKWGL